jgi:hypothetical protein
MPRWPLEGKSLNKLTDFPACMHGMAHLGFSKRSTRWCLQLERFSAKEISDFLMNISSWRNSGLCRYR